MQGLTLGPLVRLLGLDGESGDRGGACHRPGRSSPKPRSRRSKVGPAPPLITGAIRSRPPGPPLQRPATPLPSAPSALSASIALRRQRERLEQLRERRQVGPEAFLILQEELDFLEVSLSDEADRRIEQS